MMGMMSLSFTESADYVCASTTSGKVTKHRITNRCINVIIVQFYGLLIQRSIFVPGSGSWQSQLRGPRGNTHRMTHSLLLILLTNSLPQLFQMSATMGQLAVLLPPVLTNPSVQAGSRAAGLIDTGRQEAPPTAASPSGVEGQTSGSGAPQPNNNRVPAGLELATRDVPTVQTPVGQTRSTPV